VQETSQKNTQSTQINRKNEHIVFINFKHVEISQSDQKCIKKRMAIFLEFFARKLERTGVQITRMEVYIATNSRKSQRKPKAHGYEAQTQATWWIRIS